MLNTNLWGGGIVLLCIINTVRRSEEYLTILVATGNGYVKQVIVISFILADTTNYFITKYFGVTFLSIELVAGANWLIDRFHINDRII